MGESGELVEYERRKARLRGGGRCGMILIWSAVLGGYQGWVMEKICSCSVLSCKGSRSLERLLSADTGGGSSVGVVGWK